MSTVSPDSVAQDQIKAFFQRWERLESEKDAISGDLKELFAEAKGNGFDPKVLRKLFRDQKADSAERQEFEALYDLYAAALNGSLARDARDAREDDDALGITEVMQHGVNGSGSSSGRTADFGSADEGSNPSLETIPGNDAEAAENEVEVALVASSSAQPIATSGFPPSAGANDDRGSKVPPPSSAASVVTLQLRTHDPATHFLSADGLLRLHGCTNPEVCASSQPRTRLCFGCSVKHDGPTVQDGAA